MVRGKGKREKGVYKRQTLKKNSLPKDSQFPVFLIPENFRVPKKGYGYQEDILAEISDPAAWK